MKKKSTNQKEKAYAIERKVTEHLNIIGEAVYVDSDYDILFNDVPVEVKSCEVCLLGGLKPCKTGVYQTYRRPYFKVTKENHISLIEKKGYYCFVLTLRGRIILELFIKAGDLKFSRGYNGDYSYVNSEIFYSKSVLQLDEFKKKIEEERI